MPRQVERDLPAAIRRLVGDRDLLKGPTSRIYVAAG
jgi:hypothetical protein